MFPSRCLLRDSPRFHQAPPVGLNIRLPRDLFIRSEADHVVGGGVTVGVVPESVLAVDTVTQHDVFVGLLGSPALVGGVLTTGPEPRVARCVPVQAQPDSQAVSELVQLLGKWMLVRLPSVVSMFCNRGLVGCYMESAIPNISQEKAYVVIVACYCSFESS